MGHFRTVTLMGTTLTPTPAQHLASPAPPSGEKNQFFFLEEKRVRPTVELAGESKRCFLWPRNIVNFAKVGINMTVKTSKFFFCKKIFQSLLQVWAFASPVDY